MIPMRISKVREYLENLTGQITFKYNNKNCGVDPIAQDNFILWYGSKLATFDSIDKAMNVNFFGGKALRDIVDSVIDLDY